MIFLYSVERRVDMSFMKISNMICGISGAAVILFGLAVKAGLVSGVPASKGAVPIILGVVIVLWAFLMRHRYQNKYR